MNKYGIVTVGICATLCSLGSLFAAIYILLHWKQERWSCPIYFLIDRYEDNYYDDYYSYYCNYKAWSIVEFVGFLLWGIVAYCILYFVYSGRFEMYQKLYRNALLETEATTINGNDDITHQQVEMGGITASSPTVAASPPATAATAVLVDEENENEKV